MNLWGFISAAVLLTLMPGPDILFVITQSITRGRKAGMVQGTAVGEEDEIRKWFLEKAEELR